MIEQLIYKTKQKIIAKNLINLLVLLVPFSMLYIFQYGYSPSYIFIILLITTVSFIHNTLRYKNINTLDKTLKLNNSISTYYEYRNTNNPFLQSLRLKAQSALENTSLRILPKFETLSISLALSLFIITVYISHHNVDTSNVSTKNYRQDNSNTYLLKSNTSSNKGIKTRSNANSLVAKYINPGINLLKRGNETEQNNIPISPKNNISKNEKRFIESIAYESYYHR